MQSKQHLKKVINFERELKGPCAYDRYNTISKICQTRYLNLIRIQSSILILIALASSFSMISVHKEIYLRYFLIVLSILTLSVIIYQQNKNYMKGWQNARFIAESVLSNSWLFSFKIGAYNAREKEAKNSFIDNVDKIEKEVDLKTFYSIFDSNLPTIADWMQDLFNDLNIANKKSFYIQHRLNDQIDWYSKKSQLNRRQAHLWFLFSISILFSGIVLTLFIPLTQFSALGFFTTATSTLLTWRQTKRFDELKITYAVAAKELHSLKSKFELENDENDILQFVEEAEKSISREHKLWFNWTYIT